MRILTSGIVAAGLLSTGGALPHAFDQQSPAGYPAEGQPAIVRLLSNGAVPRAPLRYRPTAGTTGRMEVRFAMSMAMSADGMSLPSMSMPAMRMVADVTVTDVAASGDFSYRLTFAEIGVEDTPGVDPAVASALRNALGGSLKGLSGTGRVSNRGQPLAFDLDLATVVDPQMRQAMDPMTNSLEQMSFPLPEEPVGAGAQWEIYRRQVQGGVLSFQKTLMTLKAVDGDTLTFDVTTEQQAPRQRVSNPVLPAEVETSILGLSGTGTGTGTIDLTSLIPNSSASVRTNMTMAVSAGGNDQTMDMEVTVKVTMGPARQ